LVNFAEKKSSQVVCGKIHDLDGEVTERIGALIRDLRVVREALLSKRLKAKYVHALIGRSIFIRYLEDREVLVPEYFQNIAAKRKSWSKILTGAEERPLPTRT